MPTGAKRYLAGLLVFAALLALAFVKWSPGDTSAPAGSISDPLDAGAERTERMDNLRQPTILNAETASSPNAVSAPVSLRATPTPSQPIISSEPLELPYSHDPAPTEFLTIPSLEPPHRR
jgi:hypothetical protein